MKGTKWLLSQLRSILLSRQCSLLSVLSGRRFSAFVSGRLIGKRRYLRTCCMFAVLSVLLCSLLSCSSASADSISYVSGKSAIANLVNYRQPVASSSNGQSRNKNGDAIYFDYNATSETGGVYGLQYQLNQVVNPGDNISFSISVCGAKGGSSDYIGSFKYYGISSGDYYIHTQDAFTDLSRNCFYIFVQAERRQGIGSSDTVNFMYANNMNTPIFEALANPGYLTVVRVQTSTFNIGTPISGSALQLAIDNINKGLKIDADTSGLSTSSKQDEIIAGITAGNDQAHKDSQAQIDATNKQTEQEKNQYDQEKQEEQDRENQGKEDSNQLAGIFNITFMNPFAGLFELFNPGGCSDIPTIANWLGTEQTTYCSWWPQSIRSVLTPVFGLSSIMVLVGFVVSWLRDASVGLDKSTNIVEGFHGF